MYVSPVAGISAAGDASSAFLTFLSFFSGFGGGGGGSGRFRSARIGRAVLSRKSSLVESLAIASPLGNEVSGKELSATTADSLSMDTALFLISGALAISGFGEALAEPCLSSFEPFISRLATSATTDTSVSLDTA